MKIIFSGRGLTNYDYFPNSFSILHLPKILQQLTQVDSSTLTLRTCSFQYKECLVHFYCYYVL